MKVEQTVIPDVLVLEPTVFQDARGFFLESYNQSRFDEVAGATVQFVQDNHSLSNRNVLRGLHYQVRQPQGKLVRVVRGRIFDVAVDLRRGSATFSRWVGVELSAENKRQIWVPAGFAHGFLVLSDSAEVLYKTTDYYAPSHERCLKWDDPSVGIEWPLDGVPQVSAKDAAGKSLGECDSFDTDGLQRQY